VPRLNPVEQWENNRNRDRQVFILTLDGGLSRWEVMGMTNVQRKNWLDLLTERNKAQKKAEEKASADARSKVPRK
jgi:hypothetical protein